MQVWKIGAAAAYIPAAALGLARLPLARADQSPSAPAWTSDYEAACATARQTGKPLFVAFR